MTSATGGQEPPCPAPSERIAGLVAMIHSGLEAMMAGARPCGGAESLLFMGNWHDANPRLLICDPILEPVDKVVYQVIRQDVSPQHGTSFPSYQQIATAANVASDATVARAIAILRITRWLTLCAKARDARGRFRGNVYALHDEPLSLPDTLALDPDYMAFLHQMRVHKHARVRNVAGACLGSLEADIQAGRDVTAPIDPFQARHQSAQFVSHLRQGLDISALRINGFSGDLISGLTNRPAQVQDTPALAADRLQILKPVESSHLQNLRMDPQQNLLPQKFLSHQNLPSPCSSGSCSSSIKTTTTTTSARANARTRVSGNASPLGDLVVPQNLLSTNEQHLVDMHLQRVKPERRQAVLDVLVHQLQNGAIRSPIGYLRSLIERELLGLMADLRPASEAADSSQPLPRDEVAERVAQLHQEIHSTRQFIERLKNIHRAGNPTPQQQADHSERLKREEQRLSAVITEIRELLRQRPDLIVARSRSPTASAPDE